MSSADVPPDDAVVQEGDEPKQKLGLTVNIEAPTACERHITATIAREDVDRYLDDAIDELMPKAAVPGFRPGKAPRKLVQNRFKKELAQQVKGSLLMDSIAQITDDEELSPISEPDFDYEAVEIPEDGPLTFEFNLEVRPDFDLPQWKGMKLEKPVRDIGKDDVDEHLKRMLRKHAELADKDGPADKGDYVTVDVEFSRNGKEISQLPDVTLCLLPVLSFSDGKLPGFDTLMKGAKAGDTREATVKLSSDAPNEELRGEEVTASFQVEEVHALELPELDATMLARLGDFESEGDLRDGIKQHLERQLNYHQNRRVRDQIADLLTESADWALPPDLLRRQSERELYRAVMELQSAGFSDEEIKAHENDLRQNSRESTAVALKEHFILERIAEDEEFDAGPEDYEAEISLIALQSGENPRRVRARLEKQDLMDTLRNQIIERKVIELIKSEAQFQEVPYTPEVNETEAVDHFIGGAPERLIPEAKHGEEEKLREPADYT